MKNSITSCLEAFLQVESKAKPQQRGSDGRDSLMV